MIMTYSDAREYIDSLKPRGIAPRLTAISKLCAELDNPQNNLRYIHIAGTNGKGSVGAFLETILLSADKTVGRFVSPSVGDYLEAFTVNGEPISRKLYIECVQALIDAMPRLNSIGIYPTSFEAETAVAFLVFRKTMPDYVLLECGMGGKEDCTNIIPSPLVSVITPISFDHKQFLGNTLFEIAENKAGIIKSGTNVVSSIQPEDAMTAIQNAAAQNNATLFIANNIKNINYQIDKTDFEFEGERYVIPLLGAFQPQNAVLAIKAAQILNIAADRIKIGLASAKWQYRFERIGRYILDGAHNEGAAKMLATSLKLYFNKEKTAFICGCFKDKDYDKIAALTSPYACAVYCVTPPTERGLKSSVLCDTFRKYVKDVYNSKTIDAAISEVRLNDYDNIVIFGSLSILVEAKTLIERIQTNATM